MPLLPLLTDEQAGPETKAVFDDIRASCKTDYINNIWRALANDPKQLKLTWEKVKAAMGPGALDPPTKEIIYIAVSAANNCGYRLHPHAASARAKGTTPEMFAEPMQAVVLASQTNRVFIGLRVELDDRYNELPR